MSIPRIAALLWILMLLPASALRGQSTADLTPGTRVRILAPSTARATGYITAAHADTLVILTDGKRRGALHAVPLASIRELQISRGREPLLKSMFKDAAVGFVTGAAAGAVGAALPSLLDASECDRPRDDLCLYPGEWAVIGATLGAPAGAAMGAANGLFARDERWRAVPIKGVAVVTAGRWGEGMRLGVTVPTP
jgi:hypothetical protein